MVLDRGRDAPDHAHPPHPHPVRRRHRPAVAVRARHLRAHLDLDARAPRRARGAAPAAATRPARPCRPAAPTRRRGSVARSGGRRASVRGALQVVEHRRADDEHRRLLCAHAGSVPHPAPGPRPYRGAMATRPRPLDRRGARPAAGGPARGASRRRDQTRDRRPGPLVRGRRPAGRPGRPGRRRDGPPPGDPPASADGHVRASRRTGARPDAARRRARATRSSSRSERSGPRCCPRPNGSRSPWTASTRTPSGPSGRRGWATRSGGAARAIELHDPRGRGPVLWFQRMDPPTAAGRGRFHLDVVRARTIRRRRACRPCSPPAAVSSPTSTRPSWWVLADPEGNELCVCTRQPPAVRAPSS